MLRQVESWRETQITDAQAKLIFYPAFVEWQARRSEEPAARGSSIVLRAGIPRVLAANDVELTECVHQRVQEARSGSAVQGASQAG